MNSEYYERCTSGREDEQLLATHSAASSTSSLSNPALLAVEHPAASTGNSNHTTVFQDVARVLRVVWLGGGATLLGFVGHSVGWVVLHLASSSTGPDVGCIAGIGTAGAAALSAPSVAFYLAATSLLRNQRRTPTASAQCSPNACRRAHAGHHRARRGVGRRCAFVVVFVLYGAASGALGSAILSSKCETHALFAASVGATGWFLLALVCVVCENILRELSALQEAGTEGVESLLSI
ncbi:hypothetical protein FOMPIDRAFT_1055832 [Fomitopsis schrenkii]|uniref:Transmembrane protein n=1 Tax=Fomitopsis schrenkii TaxID=2126942 RepID=S8EV98_FOMSC|nr:hypothetical protein FOMPIDRAFT_1055832 [Fomitopsis schrenkii]